MRVERSKNAVRNIVWGILEKVMTLILPFVTTTILIKVLGAEYLGLSSLFTSMLSVLSISELGIGTAIVFSMYKPIAENDNETLCSLLNIYKKIYHLIGTIILVVGIMLTPFLPYLIKGSHPSDINIYLLYFIYLLNTVISYFLYAYKAALFSAYQRNDLASKIGALISFVSNMLKIFALLTIRSYYAYVVIIPLATICTNILNAILARRVFPEIIPRGKICNELKNGLKKRIIGLLSFKIYGVVFASLDTIVISAFLGLTPLAIYNNYYYIQTSIVGFLAILTTSITAGVGNKMVTNSKEDNYRDFKNFTFVNGWICSWCAVCLFCLYQHFMQLWVGEELLFSFDTMVLMVMYFLLPRITTMTYTYREAAGLWWEDRFRPLVSAVMNLITNLIFVQLIGINGVIISTLVCTVFINIPWGSLILFKNYFKCSPMHYFTRIIFYVSVTFVVGGITLIICNMLPSIGILPLIFKGMICVVIPNIFFLILYHQLPEFEYAKQLAVRMINKYWYKCKGDKNV